MYDTTHKGRGWGLRCTFRSFSVKMVFKAIKQVEIIYKMRMDRNKKFQGLKCGGPQHVEVGNWRRIY